LKFEFGGQTNFSYIPFNPAASNIAP